jgi:predicted RNase H-like nuclease (RuvC/YqgF family)
VKELQRENSDLQWRIARLAQTAEDLYHQVDEWKRAAKGEK